MTLNAATEKPNNIFARMKKVYFLATLEITLIIVLVFSRSLYHRFVYSSWELSSQHVEHVMALDCHVVTVLLFFFLMTAQIILGLFFKPGSIANKIHRLLGKILLCFSLVFIVAAAWNTATREFDNTLINLTFYFDLLFISLFLTRGIIAIKKKDYLKHMDSMFGAYVVLGRAAIGRLLFFFLMIYYHGTDVPLSGATLMLMASLFTYLHLIIFYALAGRLKQNISLILFQLAIYGVIYTYYPWTFYNTPPYSYPFLIG